VNRSPRPRRLIAQLALAALLATSLGACGSKQDTLSAGATKRFTVMLDFFPNADHAALYSAIAHGDFRAGGLDVQPQAPADPAEPL
jgi:putative hydroxymethylpyrimidine transport system substrate-binding protein